MDRSVSQKTADSPKSSVAAAAHERVLIVDFGSQVTQLIARRVRESGVYCEIHPFHLSAEAIMAKRPKGVILSGGPSSVFDEGAQAALSRMAWARPSSKKVR